MINANPNVEEIDKFALLNLSPLLNFNIIPIPSPIAWKSRVMVLVIAKINNYSQ